MVDDAQQGHGVHAGVLVEVGVLGGDGGLDQVGRHAIQRHASAPPACRIEDLIEQVALSVVDLGAGEAGSAGLQFFRQGQLAGDGGVGQHGTGEEEEDQRGQEQASRKYAWEHRCLWALRRRCLPLLLPQRLLPWKRRLTHRGALVLTITIVIR